MEDYILSCSSTADMTQAYYLKRNINYICFHYSIAGKSYEDDMGASIPLDQYYEMIREGASPTTSQINVEEYTRYFEGFLKEGRDVLHLCLSSGISGTYNSAMMAAEELQPKYPERALYVVDSLAASSGFGLLVDLLADKRDEGFPIEKLKEYAENSRKYVNHWFFSTDLTSYLRGGRISKTAFRLGRVLSICPLLCVDGEGKLVVIEKIRTKKKTMEAIVSRMETGAVDGKNYSGKCFISHSSSYTDARKLADMIEARFPRLNGQVMINDIGTVIGAHTGPGTVAVFFVGGKR